MIHYILTNLGVRRAFISLLIAVVIAIGGYLGVSLTLNNSPSLPADRVSCERQADQTFSCPLPPMPIPERISR